MISFGEAYRILHAKGPAQIKSSKGTEYTVYAHTLSKGDREGEPAIRAVVLNKKGQERYIYVHEDCWGAAETCQRTRAGGLYDGVKNIFRWLDEHR
jgi:hypothetical protein